MRVATLSFTEGFFQELEVHGSLEEARGYAIGFRRGALAYGAGSASCLVMPEDMDELHDRSDSAQALYAYERWCQEEELRASAPPRD